MLTWSGDDAYDESGVRVATVMRYRDIVLEIDPFVGGKPYWHAFVFHEYVLVDGEPGRWETAAEAKAAAEAHYRTYLLTHDNPLRGNDRRQNEPQPRGLIGHVRSLVKGWRSSRSNHQR